MKRQIMLVLAVVPVLALAPVSAALASEHPSTEALFCLRYVQFGNNPDFTNLRAAHYASNGAGATTHADWRTFQADLLAGKPLADIRAASARVFADCGIPAPSRLAVRV